MIPPLVNGLLPPGVHEATWAEVETVFGTNPHRKALLQGLLAALQNLRAAGCARAHLDGSFVTDKEIPGDFDGCWDGEGVDPDRLDPVLLDFRAPRLRQKAKYGGELFVNVPEGSTGKPFVEFFQIDKESGAPKGIIALDLGGLP